MALGSDTAGSVRIPACMTGNIGLKVTLGRWSTDGVVPLSQTFDTPGLLARSVSDAAYGFAALDLALGDAERFIARSSTLALDGIRIAVDDPFLWNDCDPGIAEVTRDEVDALACEGAVLRKMTLPEAAGAYQLFLEGGVSAIELRTFLDQELPDWLGQLDPIMAPAVRSAETLSAREYLGESRPAESAGAVSAPTFRRDRRHRLADALRHSPSAIGNRRCGMSYRMPIAALFATPWRSTISAYAASRCRSASTDQGCRSVCNSSRPHGRKKSCSRLRSQQSGCLVAAPSGSALRRCSHRECKFVCRVEREICYRSLWRNFPRPAAASAAGSATRSPKPRSWSTRATARTASV